MDIVALSPTGTGELGPLLDLGIGPAELFVAAGLIYTLAFIYLLDAAGLKRDHKRTMHRTLTAAVIPLFVTFAAVVLYATLTLI